MKVIQVPKLGNAGVRDDKTIAILRELVENPRISIRRLSSKLGINYMSARRRMSTLSRKYGISLGVLLPCDVVGREVAFLRVKIENYDKNSVFVNCTRVLLVSRVNNNELLIVIRGRDKREISRIIDSIRTSINGIIEFSVEYGTLEQETPMVVKGLRGRCNSVAFNGDGSKDCLTCLINGT